MKTISTLIARLSIVTITLGSLYLIAPVQAQRDTSTSDNPYLRKHDVAGTVIKMSEKDRHFVQRAMAAGEQEVENGKLASKQAQSSEVKKIAARIQSECSKINSEIVGMATRKGLSITTGTIKAQNPGKTDFDRRYLQMTEHNYTEDIPEFEKWAKSGDDHDLKAWAGKVLPMLKGHLAMVRDAMKRIK